jgi:hypothetical protein
VVAQRPVKRPRRTVEERVTRASIEHLRAALLGPDDFGPAFELVEEGANPEVGGWQRRLHRPATVGMRGDQVIVDIGFASVPYHPWSHAASRHQDLHAQPGATSLACTKPTNATHIAEGVVVTTITRREGPTSTHLVTYMWRVGEYLAQMQVGCVLADGGTGAEVEQHANAWVRAQHARLAATAPGQPAPATVLTPMQAQATVMTAPELGPGFVVVRDGPQRNGYGWERSFKRAQSPAAPYPTEIEIAAVTVPMTPRELAMLRRAGLQRRDGMQRVAFDLPQPAPTLSDTALMNTFLRHDGDKGSAIGIVWTWQEGPLLLQMQVAAYQTADVTVDAVGGMAMAWATQQREKATRVLNQAPRASLGATRAERRRAQRGTR